MPRFGVRGREGQEQLADLAWLGEQWHVGQASVMRLLEWGLNLALLPSGIVCRGATYALQDVEQHTWPPTRAGVPSPRATDWYRSVAC